VAKALTHRAKEEDRCKANGEIPEVEVASRRLFSREPNYLRDLILFWPFLLSSLIAGSALFSPRDRSLGDGLKFAVSAVVFILLAKERLFIFFVALGCVTFQGTWYLIVHPWRWDTFIATLLSGGAVWLAERYWRRPKLAYALPTEYGLIDGLLFVASICGTFVFLYFLKRL
jgi:hypothetical protein